MSFGLVMGGGGPVGVGWYAGLADGLLEAGFDLRDAHRVVGTSAGAIAGVWIAGGHPLSDLRAAAVGWSDRPINLDDLDVDAIVTLYARMAEIDLLDKAAGQELGAMAAAAVARPFQAMRERIAPALPVGAAWPEALQAVVVDVDSGELVALGRSDGIDLVDGVTASCSAAGLTQPAELGGRRLMDGGMRSATSAHVLCGSAIEEVLVLAATDDHVPIVGPVMQRVLDHEVARLRADGKRVVVVTPNDADHEAMGGNLLDVSRIPAVIDTGRAHGRNLASQLLA